MAKSINAIATDDLAICDKGCAARAIPAMAGPPARRANHPGMPVAATCGMAAGATAADE